MEIRGTVMGFARGWMIEGRGNEVMVVEVSYSI